MNESVLIDAGPIVAIYSIRDFAHEECTALLREIRPPMITTWPVLAEACWLLQDDPRSVQEVMNDCAKGFFSVAALDVEVFVWMAAFLLRYQNIKAQIADASLVYLAEHHQLDTVFTLDRRDFSIYRFGKNHAFRILP